MAVRCRGCKFDALPTLIFSKISNNLSIGVRNNLAGVNRSLQVDMGGREGWEVRKVENATAVATRKQIAEIDRKRAARELRAKRHRKE